MFQRLALRSYAAILSNNNKQQFPGAENMNRSLLLSILCDDKPGIVETLARTVSEHQGNWLESRLSQLCGKFAGILHIAVPEEQLESLRNALQSLQNQSGIQSIVSDVQPLQAQPHVISMNFSLMGNDRPGIIREISQAFASHNINLDELTTSCTSMPWSGSPMFNAHGSLHIPEHVDIDSLSEQLEAIADQLGVDIELRESESRIAD